MKPQTNNQIWCDIFKLMLLLRNESMSGDEYIIEKLQDILIGRPIFHPKINEAFDEHMKSYAFIKHCEKLNSEVL